MNISFSDNDRLHSIWAKIVSDYVDVLDEEEDQFNRDIKMQIGDRVEALHNGYPTGKFGTVQAIRDGCLEVIPDRGDPEWPWFDHESAFFQVADTVNLSKSK